MEPPLRFGQYEVLQDEDGDAVELGRGNMGITYKAHDPLLHRTVALKVINFETGYPQTCPVKTFPLNALKLHGLGGNASEWCEDWYDPANPEERVVRGACWRDYSERYLRSAFRGSVRPGDALPGYGFRCVFEPGKR